MFHSHLDVFSLPLPSFSEKQFLKILKKCIYQQFIIYCLKFERTLRNSFTRLSALFIENIQIDDFHLLQQVIALDFRYMISRLYRCLRNSVLWFHSHVSLRFKIVQIQSVSSTTEKFPWGTVPVCVCFHFLLMYQLIYPC